MSRRIWKRIALVAALGAVAVSSSACVSLLADGVTGGGTVW